VVVALRQRAAAGKRIVEPGVGGAEVVLCDGPRRDAVARLDLLLERQSLLSCDEEQSAHLSLEPAPSLLVVDGVELELFQPSDDPLARNALRRSAGCGEDELVDVLPEGERELNVALGRCQVAA
jgi:hypothetical protein